MIEEEGTDRDEVRNERKNKERVREREMVKCRKMRREEKGISLFLLYTTN